MDASLLTENEFHTHHRSNPNQHASYANRRRLSPKIASGEPCPHQLVELSLCDASERVQRFYRAQQRPSVDTKEKKRSECFQFQPRLVLPLRLHQFPLCPFKSPPSPVPLESRPAQRFPQSRRIPATRNTPRDRARLNTGTPADQLSQHASTSKTLVFSQERRVNAEPTS